MTPPPAARWGQVVAAALVLGFFTLNDWPPYSYYAVDIPGWLQLAAPGLGGWYAAQQSHGAEEYAMALGILVAGALAVPLLAMAATSHLLGTMALGDVILLSYLQRAVAHGLRLLVLVVCGLAAGAFLRLAP
ncbi:MAG: hypothetical protein AB1445_04830 [Bacillota bacterium]